MKGGTLQVEIDEQIVYGELNQRRNSIWSLLLASGYLKFICVDFSEQAGIWNYSLTLTNHEVHIMFSNMIRGWFSEQDSGYNDFIKAMLQNDLKAMNFYMNQVALVTFSYFDTGKRASGVQPERFYHGFVLGLLVELADRYILTSNRESGFGRYDVMLEPRSAEDAGCLPGNPVRHVSHCSWKCQGLHLHFVDPIESDTLCFHLFSLQSHRLHFLNFPLSWQIPHLFALV